MSKDRIRLDHGSGGQASRDLVRDILVARLDNEFLRPLDDSAVVPMAGHRLAMTTDSYVVDPIFFPGGDIGSLSVHGTVNDLAMQGAVPRYLTLGLILEDGLPMEDFRRIIDSLAAAAAEAGVSIVAGDTKVVPKGHADKIYINTAGVGPVPPGIDVASRNARPGDHILVNGPLGDHGIAILSRREGLEFGTPITSDSAPLNGLVAHMLAAYPGIHVLRDPTRGGVAASLCEIAAQSEAGIRIREEALPIRTGVHAACEILGIDPLHIANEGKCLAIVPPEASGVVLRAMKQHPLGKEAALIGEVISEHRGRVLLRTRIGGTRILSMPTGEQLPRIC